MKRGKFIVIDGIDGVGKTTQLAMLKKAFPRVVFTRDPGGTPTAQAIRDIALGTHRFSPYTNLFLFLAARAALIEDLIRPALKKGKSVISDRFDSSTYAYQVYAGKRPHFLPFLRAFRKDVHADVIPDAYILLDCDPVSAKKRLDKKAGELNAYDKKPLAYHRAVRAGFKRFKSSNSKIYYVNADRTPEEVFADVKRLVERVLG